MMNDTTRFAAILNLLSRDKRDILREAEEFSRTLTRVAEKIRTACSGQDLAVLAVTLQPLHAALAAKTATVLEFAHLVDTLSTEEGS